MRGPLSLKDISDWVKVAAMFVALGIGYAHLMGKVDTSAKQISDMQNQTTRMERYLSSSDPQYWNKVRVYEDVP